MATDHPATNWCTECGVTKSTKVQLRLHVNRQHARDPALCDVCKKTFVSTDGLRDHVGLHTDNYLCHWCHIDLPIQTRRFSNKRALKAHVLDQHEKLTATAYEKKKAKKLNAYNVIMANRERILREERDESSSTAQSVPDGLIPPHSATGGYLLDVDIHAEQGHPDSSTGGDGTDALSLVISASGSVDDEGSYLDTQEPGTPPAGHTGHPGDLPLLGPVDLTLNFNPLAPLGPRTNDPNAPNVTF
jgi:hypothetical protein